MTKVFRGAVLAAIVIGALASAPAAHSAFPGANGKIAFHTDRDGNGEIYTMNADGSNPTDITNNSAYDGFPAWSPDGTKIAFSTNRNDPNSPCPPCNFEIYTMNANGSNPTRLTSSPGYDGFPAWSPDRTKIAFVTTRDEPNPTTCSTCNYEIYTMNADGTNPTRLTNSPGFDGNPAWSPDGNHIAFDSERNGNLEVYKLSVAGATQASLTNTPNGRSSSSPNWSPDGTKIAFQTNRDADGDYEVYSMNADGTNQTNLTHDAGAFDAAPAWSPDGSKIAFETLDDPDPNCFPCIVHIFTMNADGTNLTRRTFANAADDNPDWQPLPINGYPRPRGASPMRISLVPAQKPCTAANTTHGAPLAYGSCAPAELSSQYLTTGTPDANGEPAQMVGSMLARVIAGEPATLEDEADVWLTTRITDVRNKDLTDYAGSLHANLPIRITDKDNTPSPGGPGAATTEPFAFGFDIPCSPITSPPVGSVCQLNTTIDSLVPGAIKESRRAIWQVGQVRIFDGGADGNGSTVADNTVFATEGVFVP